jgi:hypothetical protein
MQLITYPDDLYCAESGARSGLTAAFICGETPDTAAKLAAREQLMYG